MSEKMFNDQRVARAWERFAPTTLDNEIREKAEDLISGRSFIDTMFLFPTGINAMPNFLQHYNCAEFRVRVDVGVYTIRPLVFKDGELVPDGDAISVSGREYSEYYVAAAIGEALKNWPAEMIKACERYRARNYAVFLVTSTVDAMMRHLTPGAAPAVTNVWKQLDIWKCRLIIRTPGEERAVVSSRVGVEMWCRDDFSAFFIREVCGSLESIENDEDAFRFGRSITIDEYAARLADWVLSVAIDNKYGFDDAYCHESAKAVEYIRQLARNDNAGCDQILKNRCIWNAVFCYENADLKEYPSLKKSAVQFIHVDQGEYAVRFLDLNNSGEWSSERFKQLSLDEYCWLIYIAAKAEEESRKTAKTE